MPHVVGIIPARLASTRFPRKVLASATGSPLIKHVYDNACRIASLHRVVIATDSPEVAAACAAFGAPCVMTREDHPNGSSRLAEAADTLELPEDSLVVNVQGDEPELEPALVEEAVAVMLRSDAPVSTVAVPLREDFDNPAIVKAVVATGGPYPRALYFTRSRAPYPRVNTPAALAALPMGVPALRHVGMYCYRRPFLRDYIRLTPTPLEQLESLEQLRILEHGYNIAVALANAASSPGIDTPEQYEAFVARYGSHDCPDNKRARRV